MDLASALFGPGLVGGLFVALWLVIAHRRARSADHAVPARDESFLVDPINVARIRVAGIGGLGLVAMATVVAVFVPAIGVSLAIAAVTGLMLAVGLIVWRRRNGPLPSSSQRPGAATMLALDSPDSPPGARPSDPERDATRTTPRLRMA
jgi:hypothetical protein